MNLPFHRCALAALLLSAGILRADFTFEESDGRLRLADDGDPVLVFNFGEIEPPAGREGVARSSYIHPLYDPDGVPLTDDFPADHPHHRGVFLAWPRITVAEKQVDVWHMRGIRPVFKEWGQREITDTSASFEASQLWVLDDGRAVARARLRYRVHAADADGRTIDIHATVANLAGEPITLRGADAAYGGMNIRLDGDRPDVVITTAEGILEGNANAIDPPSPWADHSSRPADGRPHTGVALFQHPANPDFPARNWTLRPYGFLGAAWPGESDHVLAPGESLDLRYRLFIHRGRADEAGVAERFEAFAREAPE